jgi:hypothetical protein
MGALKQRPMGALEKHINIKMIQFLYHFFIGCNFAFIFKKNNSKL